MARKAPTFKSVRSYVLLALGVLVIIYEVTIEHTERPTIIVAALLLCGISVPLNVDEKIAWLTTLTNKPPKEPPEPGPGEPVTPPEKTGVPS